ncbi:phenylpyruvate tautomerase PptA (4-oxalocrotonate tautomerase family) [Mycobacterium sp. URHB0021]
MIGVVRNVRECRPSRAPLELVHVVFPELGADHVFTGGNPSTSAFIRGSIRAGRSEQVRRTLMQRISNSYLEITGADAMGLLVVLIDYPPTWGMEGGLVLPDITPEAQEAWMAKVTAAPEAPQG